MTKPPRYVTHPRDEIVATIDRIYRYRMTTTSGGNVSVRDGGGDIWITPARLDKGALRPADIVRVRSADGGVDGPHRPSSEYPFHRAVYAARPDLHAIVHAHSVALVAFSMCRRLPPTRIVPEAHAVCGEPGRAPYALPGSAELGERIAAVFAAGYDCALLENHGVVVGGRSLAEAFARFETLEFCAKTAIKAQRLGRVRELEDAQLVIADVPRPCEGVFEPGPASTAEREARQLVAEFVCRGYRQRLLTSTEGSFSARVGDDDTFVITARGTDRAHVTPERLVLVDGGRHEAGSTPSRAAAAHRAIYRRHPAVRAVVNAMPVNATAFAITGATLDARTIPESYLFLREVGRLPFGPHLSDPDAVAGALSPESPAAIIDNDGVIVVGTSVLDAFDRLEVLESTAEALINATTVGPLHPMGDADISRLLEAFAPAPNLTPKPSH